MSVAEPAPPQQTVASRGQALGQLGEPVRRFMRTEAGSAGLLLAATVVALGWANLSPDGYSSFWGTDLALRLGDAELVLDLQHWVNDGLMVFVFFVVGLEVKRELAMGELTDRRRATIPLVAAVAGLAVPALVFLAFNPTGEAAVAWASIQECSPTRPLLLCMESASYETGRAAAAFRRKQACSRTAGA